jgi:hypothetical protein
LDVELPSTRLGLNFINAGGSLPWTNERTTLSISERDDGRHRSNLLALEEIDAAFSTVELNIARSIYLRTSKPPDRSLDETCSTSIFTGLTDFWILKGSAYAKFEDWIFASPHIGEAHLLVGCAENIQRMTLRPGIKRIG